MEHSCTEDKFELNPKTKLKRWYRWRYSGPITIFGLIGLAILSWNVITSDIPFYDKFTCPEMMEYKNGNYGVRNQPDYEDLSDSALIKFNAEYQRCLDMGWINIED